jgi:hypothetical protein
MGLNPTAAWGKTLPWFSIDANPSRERSDRRERKLPVKKKPLFLEDCYLCDPYH